MILFDLLYNLRSFNMDINDIFNDFARAFERKIDNDYFIKLQFEIRDVENGIWQIDVNNGKVFLYNEEKIIPEEAFILSKDTLFKLYNNELSPLTAFLNEPNEKGEMCSLIELKNKTDDKRIDHDKKPQEEYLKFIYRLHKFNNFFSKNYPTKILIKKENCIKYLKTNVIGLNFDFEKGIGQLFFLIKKGETVEEPGYEFGSIYVLNGEGILKIGNEQYNINEREYYHINTKELVNIGNNNEKDLEILFMINRK
jgi:hypothetical protein